MAWTKGRWAMAAVALCAAATLACGDTTAPSGIRLALVPGDTIRGDGSVAELVARRDQWATTRGGADYRFDTDFRCFCSPPGPVTVLVRGAEVTEVRRRRDAAELPETHFYTIETLFARAIAEASRGRGYVDVTYHRSGYPARIVIGSLADDSGVSYVVGNVQLR